jgi:hypothetical protein
LPKKKKKVERSLGEKVVELHMRYVKINFENFLHPSKCLANVRYFSHVLVRCHGDKILQINSFRRIDLFWLLVSEVSIMVTNSVVSGLW